MKFYTGDLFPESFKNQIFIAEHGSWNRTPPIGYQVSLVRLDETGATTFEPFVTGWVKSDGTVWGRPVDILVEPSGALLISDDESGTIYRLKYAS
jgi:glucose/arabinose dehydrogenase